MKKTLVILAAGMGSRFGGMKQTYPVGPNGEFIMDYSIYSAIKYGFTKIVFVIRKEYLDLFKSTIGKRIENKIQVSYVFQSLDDIPSGFKVPDGRVKPWGTAHAIYEARNEIDGKFGVITADDYYGDDAFRVLSEYLDKNNNYVIIGYPIGKTLSENGSVKRGVIISEDNKVVSIIESSCTKINRKVECIPLDNNKDKFMVPLKQNVSMLMNGFNKDILDSINNCMKDDFSKNKDNLLNYEMLLPDILDKEIKRGKIVDVVSATSTWIGMTYKDDAEYLSKHILSDIRKKIYPKNLWD